MIGKKVSESEATLVHLPMPDEINAFGTLHGGHIFRRIDNAGGVTAQRHARSLVVTASVDRLDFLAPIFPGQTMTLKSSIHLVGHSSMDVGVRLEIEDITSGHITHAATCFLTYVAVNDQGQPTEVPPLILQTKDEYRRHQQAQQRRIYRKSQRQK